MNPERALDDEVQRRLDDYLAESGCEAAWFARPGSFAWLTDGGRNLVDRGASVGEAAAGYDGDGVTVVTSNIEADRLRAEELPASVAVESFPWHESDLADAVAAVSPEPASADFPVPGFDTVDASSLRQPLTSSQVADYRALAADVADAVESVARRTNPDDTELAVAGDLERALTARDAASPVVLVGGAERAQAHRHYTPQAEPLGGYALLSVTARRGGLHASCTRTVAFEDAPSWLESRTRDAMRVEAAALAATRLVGRDDGTAADVFDAIRDAYAALDWEGEWRDHHQGGAAGFAGREWVATPDCDAPVELPMAYAWNPTVEGAKSEDTCLVTGDGVEVLTATGDWPTVEVDAVDAAVEATRFSVERHAVLRR